MDNKVIINYELLLPAMGEGIIEATITKWLVSVGQHVTIDQPLVEVATDKVDSEIPAPVEGTVVRLVYREGEIPRIGEVIALIETESHESGTVRQTKPDVPVNLMKPGKGVSPISKSLKKQPAEPKENFILSPLVRMLAKQHGLSPSELNEITGTGVNGRVTRDDLNRYLLNGGAFNGERNKTVAESLLRQEIKVNPDDDVVEMDRMRKIIAAHMIASQRIAAHVTSFLEADITPLVQWRDQRKEDFFKSENARLTFTPVFIEAVARSLKEFPRINVTVSGESIIMHKSVNVGVATALADGNLIVPVIKNADHENLGGLSRKLSDLASRARNGTLLPEEIKGGTFTITNIGQYNNLTGTPIINQPESAILAFGTIIKKPWAVKTDGGFGVAVRDIIMLALSYDHRVIDGALGGSFLSSVAGHLERFDTSRNV